MFACLSYTDLFINDLKEIIVLIKIIFYKNLNKRECYFHLLSGAILLIFWNQSSS